MKVLPAIIGFIIGVALTVAAYTMINSANEALRKVQLLSDVHDPLRECLDDIVQTRQRGDVVLADRKTRLLQQRWNAYLQGGRAPDQFSSEIMNLTAAATLRAQ